MQLHGQARSRRGSRGEARGVPVARAFGLGLALVGMLLLVNAQMARAQEDEGDLTPLETVPPDETPAPDDTTPPDDTAITDDATPPDDAVVTDETTPTDETAPTDDTAPTDGSTPPDDLGGDPNANTDSGTTTTSSAPTTTAAVAPATLGAASSSAALLTDPASRTFTLAALPVAAASPVPLAPTPVAAATAALAAGSARTADPLPTTGSDSRGQLALGLCALSAGLIVVGATRRRALAPERRAAP